MRGACTGARSKPSSPADQLALTCSAGRDAAASETLLPPRRSISWCLLALSLPVGSLASLPKTTFKIRLPGAESLHGLAGWIEDAAINAKEKSAWDYDRRQAAITLASSCWCPVLAGSLTSSGPSRWWLRSWP